MTRMTQATCQPVFCGLAGLSALLRNARLLGAAVDVLEARKFVTAFCLDDGTDLMPNTIDR